MKNGKSDKQLRNTSKFISLLLRHQLEAIGITLDEHGWADVQELIDGINRSDGHTLDMELLEEIVRTDEKQRYSFNEDHTLIRANQGHSGRCRTGGKGSSGNSLAWYRREIRLFYRCAGAYSKEQVVCASFLEYGDCAESRQPAR